jgi:hypothetical protein
MQRLTALFPIALALGAIVLASAADAKEPIPIKACQTISQPGSYELVDNLTAGGGKDCLVITASFVTIDLAGFSISPSPGTLGGTAILFASQIGGGGIALRNGSITQFTGGVDLSSARGSIVEGMRIVGPPIGVCCFGISATGIVKGNTLETFGGAGISATGTVTGNYVSGAGVGIEIGPGSTVIGNTVADSFRIGLLVSCPSNVTDNTSVNPGNARNLVLNGEGCHNEDNVAP